ncbi:MAG: imidazole glycerol phosphate synthase subunit HisH [Alphaproteobacteria bacterium]
MRVAVIDYGSGNLRSVAKAVARVAGEDAVQVTADPADVARAERVVLPGVGAFADCYAGLSAIDDMVAALEQRVHREGAPFLGICVGMQLMADVGVEFGRHQGLGWMAGEVVRIEPEGHTIRVPQMGWNALRIHRPHPVLDGIADGDHVYFANSYHFRVADAADVVAEVDYGGRMVAMVARDNIAGTQFHPEKSQKLGLRVLENFLEWKP